MEIINTDSQNSIHFAHMIEEWQPRNLATKKGKLLENVSLLEQLNEKLMDFIVLVVFVSYAYYLFFSIIFHWLGDSC